MKRERWLQQNVTREGKKANKWREDEKQNRMPSFAGCRGVLLDSYECPNHLACPPANVVKTEFRSFVAS